MERAKKHCLLNTAQTFDFTCLNKYFQKDKSQWLTFLLVSLTATLTFLLFWGFNVFLLVLALALPWLSLHWEILNMLLSQFPLIFFQTQNFLCETFEYSRVDWTRSLNSVLLRLLLNFLSELRMILMQISLIVNMRSSLTHRHGLQLLKLLLQLTETKSSVCTMRINLLQLQ